MSTGLLKGVWVSLLLFFLFLFLLLLPQRLLAFHADHCPRLLLISRKCLNGHTINLKSFLWQVVVEEEFCSVFSQSTLIVSRYPICNELCYKIVKSQFDRGLGLWARFPKDRAEGDAG